MDELIAYLKKFNDDRDWNQFHTPNNLVKSIVLEANELLEHFQFSDEYNQKDKEAICDELADVMAYCLDLAYVLDIDPIENIYRKMKQNEAKYPIEKAKGSSKKYTEL